MAQTTPSKEEANEEPKKIHLAILDDYAAIAPKHFSHLPQLKITSLPNTISSYTNPQNLESQISRLKPYHIISTMRERTPFPAALIKELPNLKLLLTTSVRNASIDLPACSERGVIVTGTKGDVPTDPALRAKLPDLPSPKGWSTVIQHAFALLLSLCSRLPQDHLALQTETDNNAWQSGLMIPLAGKKMGIVGLGKLGVGMASTAVRGFGMEVLAWSESLTQERADEAARGVGLGEGSFRCVGKEELFREADVVSLHYVLSPRSLNLVSATELSWMKKSAILVNTSRGGLISEADLITCLKAGGIKGCALDVFWEEPLSPGSQWRRVGEWSRSEVVLSPHMGYANAGTMERWYQEQGQIVGAWLKGGEVENRMN